jgi:hypothetical protein
MTWEAPAQGKSAAGKMKHSKAPSKGQEGTDDAASIAAATSSAEDRTTAAMGRLSGMVNSSNGGMRFASL